LQLASVRILAGFGIAAAAWATHRRK